MADKMTKKQVVAASSGGPIYFWGIIGALVFTMQQADSFGSVIWGILESFAWPAVVIYHLFKLWM